MTEAATSVDSGTIDWGDTDFQPETTNQFGDGLRIFRMSQKWPDNPIQGRKFQLGGKERVTLLEETVYHCWTHRYSKQHLGSGVNGTRRCTLETLGHCLACEHWESAPDKDGKTHGAARCGRRQQTFGVNLLVYKTNLEGSMLDEESRKISYNPQTGFYHDDDNSPAMFVYEVYMWRFSADKFVSIREIKREWQSVKKNDLMFTLAPGKPENFQDFSPTVLPISSVVELHKHNKEKAAEVIEYYKNHRYDIPAILGKEHSDDDVRFFLGQGPDPRGESSSTTTMDVEEMAASIEQELAKIGDGSSDALVDVSAEKGDNVEPPSDPEKGVNPVPLETPPIENPPETPQEPAPEKETEPSSDFDALLS